MTASYRIGVCGSPQCPRSCGRTGAARQGRLQLYPMAHTLGGNAALHHARMPATDGCIRVIATMLEDPSIPRRADVRLTMWEAADMRTAVACTAEDVCAVDMDGYSERWKRHRRQNRERMDAQYTVERFVDYLRAAKGLSEHTVAAYRSDVLQCLDALAASGKTGSTV